MNETYLTIVGNLTDDPELRYTPTGAALCKFTVASTPRTYDKTSGEWRDNEPLFLNCTAWRDLAENIAESLTRGARVVVTGRLKLSRWQTPEGEKRSAYGLDADEVGPSLRFATARVKKLARTSNGHHPAAADDPWATASPTRPSAAPDDPFAATGPARPAESPAQGWAGDEPPF